MKIKPKAAPGLLPRLGSPGRASGVELGQSRGAGGMGGTGAREFGGSCPPSCPRSPYCELCRRRPWPPGPGGPRCSTGSWGCSACRARSAGLTPGAAAHRAPAFSPRCRAALRGTRAKAAPLGSLPGSTGAKAEHGPSPESCQNPPGRDLPGLAAKPCEMPEVGREGASGASPGRELKPADCKTRPASGGHAAGGNASASCSRKNFPALQPAPGTPGPAAGRAPVLRSGSIGTGIWEAEPGQDLYPGSVPSPGYLCQHGGCSPPLAPTQQHPARLARSCLGSLSGMWGAGWDMGCRVRCRTG